MNDWGLIQRYVEAGSQEAFGDLVRRYLDLVYCTCQRELQDASLAEEAAQAVFLILARKAHSFRSRTTLSSWLFQTAVFTAKNLRRQEQRRQRQEQEAASQMAHTGSNAAHGWEEAEPLLNAALQSLSNAEQALILARFWEDHSLAEIGSTLGITEDAARMRVNRALDKLRRYFAARSIILPASALAALLPQAIHPAPAHCAEALLRLLPPPTSTAAISTSAHLLAHGVLTMMTVKRLKLQLGAAALVAALSIGTVGAVRMNSQAKAHMVAAEKQADSDRAAAVLDQMYATYAAMKSFKCHVAIQQEPLGAASEADYELERPNKVRFQRVTAFTPSNLVRPEAIDLSGQSLAVSDGENLYVTSTINHGLADRYARIPLADPATNSYNFGDWGSLPANGGEGYAGMPDVMVGLKLRPTVNLDEPEYSLGQPATINFPGMARPILVNVVVARMTARVGTQGNSKGASETVTYYIGQQDHLLYQVIATEMLTPTNSNNMTETITKVEINKALNPADFVFTPPPGSHEVPSTADLFPGGKM